MIIQYQHGKEISNRIWGIHVLVAGARAGIAEGTIAVEEELVPSRGESARQLRFGFRDAALQIKEPSAGVAMEVMMMLLPREFIASRLSRNLNGNKPPFVNQAQNIAVDGGDPDCWMVFHRSLEHFIGRQRSIRLFKGTPDGGLLLRVPLIHR
jgi:hypothetical protein